MYVHFIRLFVYSKICSESCPLSSTPVKMSSNSNNFTGGTPEIHNNLVVGDELLIDGCFYKLPRSISFS